MTTKPLPERLPLTDEDLSQLDDLMPEMAEIVPAWTGILESAVAQIRSQTARIEALEAQVAGKIIIDKDDLSKCADALESMVDIMGIVPIKLKNAPNIRDFAIKIRRMSNEAALRSTVPADVVCVPRIPTIEMSIAFAEVFYLKKRGYNDDDISDWWSAMLDAALSSGGR